MAGTGVAFRGCLSTELPSDPKVKYSGYCAIRSKPLEVYMHYCKYDLFFSIGEISVCPAQML